MDNEDGQRGTRRKTASAGRKERAGNVRAAGDPRNVGRPLKKMPLFYARGAFDDFLRRRREAHGRCAATGACDDDAAATDGVPDAGDTTTAAAASCHGTTMQMCPCRCKPSRRLLRASAPSPT